MNECRFVGNVVKTPEIAQTKTGKSTCSIRLAIPRRYRNQQTGEREADFLLFTAYEALAEHAVKYLRQGAKILMSAHVQTGRYEKNGETVYRTDFIADGIEFLNLVGLDSQQAPAAAEPKRTSEGYMDVSDAMQEELPF